MNFRTSTHISRNTTARWCRWSRDPSTLMHKPHCVKSVHIRSFFGPYFPTFGLNVERYSVSLRIQSECGKIRTRKNRNIDTFHAVFRTLFARKCSDKKDVWWGRKYPFGYIWAIFLRFYCLVSKRILWRNLTENYFHTNI